MPKLNGETTFLYTTQFRDAHTSNKYCGSQAVRLRHTFFYLVKWKGQSR